MKDTESLRKVFEDFVADFKYFEDWVFIDWHNINGSGNCRIRYIINEKLGELHISGDLGSAVFYWYGKNTWQNIAGYAESLEYFISKTEANSEAGYYDEETAREELEYYFSEEDWNDEIEDKLECTREEFLERAMDCWNQYGKGEFSSSGCYDDDIVNILYESDIYSAGKTASTREKLWAVGLQMILEKYNEK